MIVGFTGTRNGMTEDQINTLRRLLIGFVKPGEFRFRHGDCLGADSEAHNIAKSLGYNIIIHPPSNGVLRGFCQGDSYLKPLHYIKRNKAIVDRSEVIIAAPKTKEAPLNSRGEGTWFTIRYGKKIGKIVIIIHPDGNITRFDPSKGN